MTMFGNSCTHLIVHTVLVSDHVRDITSSHTWKNGFIPNVLRQGRLKMCHRLTEIHTLHFVYLSSSQCLLALWTAAVFGNSSAHLILCVITLHQWDAAVYGNMSTYLVYTLCVTSWNSFFNPVFILLLQLVLSNWRDVK